MGEEKEQFKDEYDETDAYPGSVDEGDGAEDEFMDFFENNEKLKELSGHLARLRAVRVPGRGELTLKEAIAAAQEQAEAYERWLRSGEPLGEIKVWAEGREVMTVLPHLPAQLKHITFEMPSPESAVLQITSKLNGEYVVLYNFRLRDVPEEGFKHTEAWPNGEKISLKIRREGQGRFNVEIAVNPHLSRVVHLRAAAAAAASAGNTDIKREDGDARAEENGSKRVSLARRWERLKESLRPQSLGLTHAPVAFALALWLVTLAGLIGGALRTGGIFQSLAGECEQAYSRGADVNVAQLHDLNLPTVEQRGAAANPSDVYLKDAGLKPSASSNSQGKKKKAAKASASATPATPPASSRAIRKEDGQITRAAYTFRAPSESTSHDRAPVEVSRWDARRFAKLAEVQTVYVQLDRPKVGQAPMPEESLLLFVRALEASKRFRVLDVPDQQRTDAVITLRFEPDDARLGAVFVDVRDTAGTFLWQDFAGCSEQMEGGQSTMCSEAYVHLVNNLQGDIGLAQQSAGQATMLAADR